MSFIRNWFIFAEVSELCRTLCMFEAFSFPFSKSSLQFYIFVMLISKSSLRISHWILCFLFEVAYSSRCYSHKHNCNLLPPSTYKLCEAITGILVKGYQLYTAGMRMFIVREVCFIFLFLVTNLWILSHGFDGLLLKNWMFCMALIKHSGFKNRGGGEGRREKNLDHNLLEK